MAGATAYDFLVKTFRCLNDHRIIKTLRSYHPTGRPGYPPRPMLRAHLTAYLLNLPSTNELIRRLQDEPTLRELCGFNGNEPLPCRRTFNHFYRRLSHHPELVEACIWQTTRSLKRYFPDLGRELAVDATVVRSNARYKKGKPGSDPEASWGVTHSPQTLNKDGVDMVFGYKLHMVSDANHGIPLAFTVTTGKRHESPLLPALNDRAKASLPWFKPEMLTADRAYDAKHNHVFLFRQGVLPIIHIKKPGNKSGLYQDIYTWEGVPTCIGQKPMAYKGTTDQGHHVYQCNPKGCKLRGSTAGGIRHCDGFHIQDPLDDILLFGAIRRNGPEWKRLYKKRGSIERLFKSLKEGRRLERHYLRGKRLITLHCLFSVLAFQLSALTNLKEGRKADARWQVRRID